MSERPVRGEGRDEQLGAALRELEVPPPGPEFYSRLLARLEAEADAPIPTRARWSGKPLRRAFGMAALVAAVMLGSVLLPRVGSLGPFAFGPGPAGAVTADEVRAKVQDAVAATRNLRGEAALVRGDGQGTETIQGFRFMISADGDFRVTELDGRSDLSYRASDGLQRSFSAAGTGATVLAAESRGLATGPPDPSPTASVLLREVGALVRSFLGSDADVPVAEEEYQGRPAWRLVIPVARPFGAPPGQEPIASEELDVTVDQETGFPLRTTDRRLRQDGSVVSYSEARLSQLQANQTSAPDAFVLEFPSGSRNVARLDHGFQRVRLSDVVGVVGYRPLVPDKLPDGFELTEVATARRAGSTAGGRNPASRNVVSLAFQRGFDRFVVTMRETGPDRRAWADPLFEIGVLELNTRPFAPSTGALRGGDGEIVTNPLRGPHAWVVTDGLVVTVSGDLSEGEIAVILESLR